MSKKIKCAREMGIETTAEGVNGLVPHMRADGGQIVFDATSACVHADNSRKVNAQGALMIDLTPAAIGPFCELRRKKMVGGQEDMIEDTAMTMARERGLLKAA